MGQEAQRPLAAAGLHVIDLSGGTPPRRPPGAGRRCARRGGVDALVVAGGDGMAHLGANVCAGTTSRSASSPPAPGTTSPASSGCRSSTPPRPSPGIAAGSTRTVDATTAYRRRRRPAVVRRRPRRRVRRGRQRAGQRVAMAEGHMRYNLAMLRELPVFRPIHYRLEIDGVRHDTAAMLVAIGNGPAYGGGMKVVPRRRVRRRPGRRPHPPRVWASPPSSASSRRCSPVPTSSTRRSRSSGAGTSDIERPGIVGYADGERFGPLPSTSRSSLAR